MVVNWVISKGSSSNKPPLKVILRDTSYLHKTEQGHIAVLKPVIDKIVLTVGIKDELAQEAVLEGLGFSVKDEAQPEYTQAVTKNVPYKYKVRFTPSGSEHHVSIFAGAYNKNLNFLKFEFNPAALGKDGVEKFKDAVAEIFLGNLTYDDLLATANISRLDIAVDVVNLGMDRLLIEPKIDGKTHAYFGLSGVLETAYLGTKPKSNSPLKVYNKTQEELDTKKPPKVPGAEVVRIERTVFTKLKLATLHKLKNHLKGLDVFVPTVSICPEGQHHWLMFLDSCKFRGVQGALEQIPVELRDDYEDALETGKNSIWKPDKIWDDWPEILKKSGLIEGDSP